MYFLHLCPANPVRVRAELRLNINKFWFWVYNQLFFTDLHNIIIILD
jgi:hypothetical protein